MERLPAGICRAPSCKNAWECYPGSNNILSRPPRDCLRCWSDRRASLSEWSLGHSTAPVRNRGADDCRKYPAGHPLPNGRRGSEHGRAADNPRPCHARCNLHGRFPIVARSSKDPSVSSAPYVRAPPSVFVLPPSCLSPWSDDYETTSSTSFSDSCEDTAAKPATSQKTLIAPLAAVSFANNSQ